MTNMELAELRRRLSVADDQLISLWDFGLLLEFFSEHGTNSEEMKNEVETPVKEWLEGQLPEEKYIKRARGLKRIIDATKDLVSREDIWSFLESHNYLLGFVPEGVAGTDRELELLKIIDLVNRSLFPFSSNRIKQLVNKKEISIDQLAELLEEESLSIAIWLGGHLQPPLRNRRKLVNLEKVLNALKDIIKPENHFEFFTQNHPLLGGVRPIDLIRVDREQEVIDMIERAKQGTFS